MRATLDIARVIGTPVPVRKIVSLAAAKAAEKLATDAYLADDYDTAIKGFHEARRLGLETALLHSGLGTAYMFTGQVVKAIESYRHALRLGGQEDETGRPSAERYGEWAPKCMSNLIQLLDTRPETTLETALANRKVYWSAFGAPLRPTWRRHANDADPDRPLRIGYVSGDFRRHSAATGFSPVVMRHSEGYRPVCFSSCDQEDAVTEGFEEVSEFHRVAKCSDAQVAEQIRAAAIDILVDLSGYTAFNRLVAFLRRPAPVQVNGWGYATGSGLQVFDGFFCDEYAVPKKFAARGYVEPLLYLPSIVPFSPMPYSEPVGPLPCLAAPDGRFTFASFNRWNKCGPSVLSAWGEILRALPNSRLLLKEKIYERDDIRQAALAGIGVEASRVEFRPWSAHEDHLRTYHEVDLALDPFPHTGGVTALEGLWHGVPPLTLAGERVPERLSASFLTTLKMPTFIATSRADYIQRAIGLATEVRPQLAEIRSTLQYRIAESPLCNGYVSAVEAHYRTLWRSWCRRQTA